MHTHTSDLLRFLDASPCNFWAAKNLSDRLSAAGFQPLDMRDKWNLRAGGRYFVTKNDSAVFAFAVGSDPLGVSYSVRPQRFARLPYQTQR